MSNFNAPDYLLNITNNIKAHPDADLVVIRATYPHDKFDGNTDYQSDQAWRLLAYNWTDINHDGKLWTDKNGNGVVNHADKTTSSNIDGFNDINFKQSEMEQGEYERFFYHRPGSNILMGFINHPNQRMADGIYLGFQHSTKNPAIDQTDFKIEIDYYKNVDWPWVTETQPSGGTSPRRWPCPPTRRPACTRARSSRRRARSRSIVPVAVTVAATVAQNTDGSLCVGAQLRRRRRRERAVDVALQQRLDLRRQRLDVASGVGRLAVLLLQRREARSGRDAVPVRHDVGRPDGHRPRHAAVRPDRPGVRRAVPLRPGHVRVDRHGRRERQRLSRAAARGRSTRRRATTRKWSPAPASQGATRSSSTGSVFNGDKFNVPFKTTLGALSVNPTSVTSNAAADGTGSFDVTVKSSLALAGLKRRRVRAQPAAVVHGAPDSRTTRPNPTRAPRRRR